LLGSVMLILSFLLGTRAYLIMSFEGPFVGNVLRKSPAQ
jgi:hypothetical protein